MLPEWNPHQCVHNLMPMCDATSKQFQCSSANIKCDKCIQSTISPAPTWSGYNSPDSCPDMKHSKTKCNSPPKVVYWTGLTTCYCDGILKNVSTTSCVCDPKQIHKSTKIKCDNNCDRSNPKGSATEKGGKSGCSGQRCRVCGNAQSYQAKMLTILNHYLANL